MFAEPLSGRPASRPLRPGRPAKLLIKITQITTSLSHRPLASHFIGPGEPNATRTGQVSPAPGGRSQRRQPEPSPAPKAELGPARPAGGPYRATEPGAARLSSGGRRAVVCEASAAGHCLGGAGRRQNNSAPIERPATLCRPLTSSSALVVVSI